MAEDKSTRDRERVILNFSMQLKEQEKSANTVAKYCRDLRRFLQFLNGQSLTAMTVREYKESLLKHYPARSVNSMLVPVNLFLKQQKRSDCLVKLIKIQRGSFRDVREELSKEEYVCLLRTARTTNRRLYYIMQSLGAAGIRIGELRFLTVESLKRRQMEIFAKGKCRTVLLPESLCSDLEEYCICAGRKKGSIFVTRSGSPVDRSNISHELKHLAIAAGVDPKKVFPHNFRHLFAVSYYESSKDLAHLADLLGHSSMETTRIYTQISRKEQEKQLKNLGMTYEECAGADQISECDSTTTFLFVYGRGGMYYTERKRRIVCRIGKEADRTEQRDNKGEKDGRIIVRSGVL